MSQHHWIVNQEGALPILLDEMAQVIGDHIRPKLSGLEVLFGSIDFEPGIGVAARTPRQLPQAVLIKAEVTRPLKATFELPLASDRRSIARLA